MVMSIVTVSIEFLYLAFCLKDIMSRINVGGGWTLNRTVGEEWHRWLQAGGKIKVPKRETEGAVLLSESVSSGLRYVEVAFDCVVIQDLTVCEFSWGSQACLFNVCVKWH